MIRLYLLWATLVLGAYAYAGFTGWRVPHGPREVIPASVRSSPGGYRSFHFWHTGSSGGK